MARKEQHPERKDRKARKSAPGQPFRVPELAVESAAVASDKATARAAARSKEREFGALVLACGCVSAYQDGKYGAGRRVFNRAPCHGARCTVCGGARGV